MAEITLSVPVIHCQVCVETIKANLMVETADTKIAVVGAAKKSGAAVEQKKKDQAEFVRVVG